MSSKHTPGPWHAVSHYCDSITVVDSGGFEHVSATHCAILLDYTAKLGICHWADSPDASRELSEEEQAANAVLIAAAPDLYAAVAAVIEAARAYLPPDGITKEEFISLVIAAIDNPQIAKAIRGIES